MSTLKLYAYAMPADKMSMLLYMTAVLLYIVHVPGIACQVPGTCPAGIVVREVEHDHSLLNLHGAGTWYMCLQYHCIIHQSVYFGCEQYGMHFSRA